VGICKQTTILIFYYVTSRMVNSLTGLFTHTLVSVKKFT